MKKKITQNDLIIEFFTKNPKVNIPHPKVVDYVTDK